jgi:hypothetical protein
MQAALKLIGGGRDDDGHFDPEWASGPLPHELEDLPYRVEVWDETGSYPEILVAISVSAALAYAAYYAAAREFFGRDVTLKLRGETLSHWRVRRN